MKLKEKLTFGQGRLYICSFNYRFKLFIQHLLGRTFSLSLNTFLNNIIETLQLEPVKREVIFVVL